jgi:hypothetical protein
VIPSGLATTSIRRQPPRERPAGEKQVLPTPLNALGRLSAVGDRQRDRLLLGQPVRGLVDRQRPGRDVPARTGAGRRPDGGRLTAGRSSSAQACAR